MHCRVTKYHVHVHVGLLPPVELEIVSNTSSITISWSAPFSLDVTGVDPDIWYSVLIYNVTDEDHPRVVPCTDCTNLTETHYIFSPEHYSPCHEYTFIIIPVNGVGEGSSRNATTSEFRFCVSAGISCCYIPSSAPWNCSIHVISSSKWLALVHVCLM